MRNNRVLIVDDTNDSLNFLVRILKDEYELFKVSNSKEALDILHINTEIIDIVLINIDAHDIDGYELLSSIKNDKEISSIPVLIISSSNNEESERKALAYGANDYISKSNPVDIIQKRIENTIQFKRIMSNANMAKIDYLTGMLNREEFFRRAKELIKTHQKGYYVLNTFNISQFKIINDQYGIEVGDLVIKDLADVLYAGLNPIGGLVARIMADKFAILYPIQYMDSDYLNSIQKKVMEFYRKRGLVNKPRINIGRYIVDDINLDVNAMYCRAILAEESIKGRTDVCVAVFKEEMLDKLLFEQRITTDMKDALINNEFKIKLQPQINHLNGAIVGAEALARWHHPKLGLITPSDFIPIFEKNGFIYEFDKYIWELVAKTISKWKKNNYRIIPISINISRFDATQKDLVPYLEELIKKYSLSFEDIRLEITESAFVDSFNSLIETIKSLQEKGFIVAIDDFGRGYSSLSALKNFPVDVLKLDMDFFKTTASNSQRSGIIFESIIRMARWIGITVIAEGVETKESADFLSTVGCKYIQGYCYSKPLEINDFEEFIKNKDIELSFDSINISSSRNSMSFWDPDSLYTLVFNDYVGVACILEVLDDKIEVIRANDLYLKTIGFDNLSMEFALNMNLDNILTQKDMEIFKNAVLEVLNHRNEIIREFKIRNDELTDKNHIVQICLRFLASNGNRSLVFASFTNITDLRKAEENANIINDKLQTILNNVNSGVVISQLDENGDLKYVSTNPFYYQMFGYTKKQFDEEVGDLYYLIIESDRTRVRRILTEHRKKGSNVKFDCTCKKRDGSLIRTHNETTSVIIGNANMPYLFTFISDITVMDKFIQDAKKNSK